MLQLDIVYKAYNVCNYFQDFVNDLLSDRPEITINIKGCYLWIGAMMTLDLYMSLDQVLSNESQSPTVHFHQLISLFIEF